MLEEIVPGCVALAERRGDVGDARLFVEEQALVARAVEARRREFTTGRVCARAALAQLDVPPRALLADADGAPQWPEGVVGSITHCAGYRACAVAHAAEIASIGIDAEPNRPLPAGVLEAIAHPSERVALAALMRESPAISWDRLLFSLKEAVYKTWHPLAARRLGFEDALVTIDRRLRSFSALLLRGGPLLCGRRLSRLSGRWVCRDGLLLAAVTLPASAASTAPAPVRLPRLGRREGALARAHGEDLRGR